MTDDTRPATPGPDVGPERRPAPARGEFTPPASERAESAPPALQAAWKGRVSTSLVSIPYVALVIFWIGFFVLADSWAALTWLAVMWLACLVLLPMAIVGGFWGLRAGSRALLVWGIIAAVLCLPGCVLSFTLLISAVGGWA